MVEAAEGLVQRVDDVAHRDQTFLHCAPLGQSWRRPKVAARAREEVEFLVGHLVPVVPRPNGEVDAVVQD